MLILGPATFAYELINSSSILVSDWTRTGRNIINEDIFNKTLFYIQRYILQRFKRICSRTLEFKKHLIKITI